MKRSKNNNPPDIDATTFQIIFAQSPISTQIFSASGIALTANAAWEKMWAVKHSVLEGWYNVLEDEELKKHNVLLYIKAAFKGKISEVPPIRYETATVLKNKGQVPYRWVQALIYPIKDSNGRVKHVVLQHDDITKEKDAEDNLLQSESRLKAMWDSTPDAVALSDEHGIVLAVNEAYCKLYGYAASELIGKTFAIIFPKNQRDFAIKSYLSIFRSKTATAKVEVDVVSKSGKKHRVESQYSFIVDGGKRVAMLSVIRDITPSHQATVSLQKEQERLQLALVAGNIGVWDWDLKTDALSWSDKVYELHGIAPETPISVDYFRSLIHVDDRERLKIAIEKSLKDGAPYDVDLRIVTPAGEVRWLTTSAIVKFDAKGSPLRMLGATSDITRKKEMEQERSDFVGIATHELKTPVTSLKVYTESLVQKFQRAHDSTSASYLIRMNTQIDKLSRLIDDLLDVTKIEGGKLQMKSERFSFDDLVSETVEDVRHTSEKHSIRIEGKTGITVFADRERTGQVLINLLTNAIKYSPASSKILVRLGKSTEGVQVSVTDYGVGIPKSKHALIFERFYRVRGNNTNTFPGLGLGLYISREIVARQRGKIWFTSKMGKGSTFSFSLPTATALKSRSAKPLASLA